MLGQQVNSPGFLLFSNKQINKNVALFVETTKVQLQMQTRILKEMKPSFSSSPPVGQLTDLASNPLSIIKARLCSEESQGVAN